jgi:hypothetical protein
VIDEEDFDEFIDANPQVVRGLRAKIRDSLLQGVPAVRDFLETEYCDWLMRTKGVECPYRGP